MQQWHHLLALLGSHCSASVLVSCVCWVSFLCQPTLNNLVLFTTLLTHTHLTPHRVRARGTAAAVPFASVQAYAAFSLLCQPPPTQSTSVLQAGQGKRHLSAETLARGNKWGRGLGKFLHFKKKNIKSPV